MKWTFYLPLLITLIFSGCGLKERETALQKREAVLAQKEQELVLKENNLQLKEAELVKREQQLKESQKIDTTVTQNVIGVYNPALVGKWNAKMVCIETTCTGSAIGDTKTETWDVSYQNERVIAKVMNNESLVRIYTGTYRNNLLELTENVETSSAAPATKMVVRLTLLSPTTMEGQREIIRAGECRIVYAVQLEKQQ